MAAAGACAVYAETAANYQTFSVEEQTQPITTIKAANSKDNAFTMEIPQNASGLAGESKKDQIEPFYTNSEFSTFIEMTDLVETPTSTVVIIEGNTVSTNDTVIEKETEKKNHIQPLNGTSQDNTFTTEVTNNASGLTIKEEECFQPFTANNDSTTKSVIMEKTHVVESVNYIESLTHEEEEDQIQPNATTCASNISTVLTEATVAVSIEATALPAINTNTSGSHVDIVGMDTTSTDVAFTKD